MTVVHAAGPTAKKRSKVAEDDLVEHPLSTGGWEGSGAMQKAGEIRIRVSAGSAGKGDAIMQWWTGKAGVLGDSLRAVLMPEEGVLRTGRSTMWAMHP